MSLRIPAPRVSLLLKIAGLTSLPVLAIMIAALLVVNGRLAGEVNQNVTADLQRAALAFENQMEREGENLERVGVVVARDPKFFALLTLPRGDRKDADFHATLLGVARDFQHDAEAPLFDVTDEQGIVLARAGAAPEAGGQDRSHWPLVHEALAGRAARGYLVEGERAYRVAVVPIVVDGSLIATLTLGRMVDAALAERLKATTRSDVVFVVNGTPSVRTTLQSPLADRLARLPASPGAIRLTEGDHRFLALAGSLTDPTAGGRVGFVLLRSLDRETAVLGRIGRDLTVGGVALIVVALGIGLLVSTGVTRPVRRIIEAANAMRRGNYDLPLGIRSGDEMGVLADHFEAMRDAQRHEIERLEEIDRMKTNFIAIASHEILTPVTTIRAFADLMGEGPGAGDAELQREGFRAIREAAGSLTRLARDLTNMSLIDRRRLPLRLEPADLARITEEVAVRTIALATERHQTVSLAIEPELLHTGVDADYLKQALTNLAQNAVRFTRDGGSIEIGARRAGEAFELYVTDSGIGISKDDFERIFAKIVELKDVNLHSSGTTEFNSSGLGLGLSIARGIVEAHGGEIRVESELGHGSTFTILLPASAPVGASVHTPVDRNEPDEGTDLRLAS